MKNPIKSIKAEYMMRCYAGQNPIAAIIAMTISRALTALWFGLFLIMMGLIVWSIVVR